MLFEKRNEVARVAQIISKKYIELIMYYLNIRKRFI